MIVPLAFHLQGLYRLRRGRSRIDDFFNVLVGSIIAVVIGVVEHAVLPGLLRARRAARTAAPTKCRSWRWGIFLVFNIALGYLSRKLVREALERRWIAGVGLRRILIAGAGDLGRMVADKMLEHRELGYQIVGFVDDRAGGDHLGYRGLPLLGRLSEAAEIVRREKIDHLYVALPLEEHMKLLDLVESTSREGVDVQGRARPAAVHRAARAARGSRRRPGHQPQRRAAAGRQRARQARARHRDLRRGAR